MATDQELKREREKAVEAAWDAFAKAGARVGSVVAAEVDQIEAYRAKREEACRAWVAEAVAIDVASAAWEALKAATIAMGNAYQETETAKEALVEAEAAYRAVSRGVMLPRTATQARG